MKKEKHDPSSEIMFDRRVAIDGWLLLGATLIAGAIGMVSYSFTTFETVSHAREQKDSIEKRLDRIEQKIDQLIAK